MLNATEQTATDPEIAQDADDGWEWAVVEVFGHRRHAGRTREEERFGAKLLRIDVPNKADPDQHGWTTVYYGGSSIFSFSPCTRETAMRINKPYERPTPYALPAPDDDGEGDRFADESPF